jgi:hypothetical protein
VTLLKVTHIPIVAIIWIFEAILGKIQGDAPLFSTLGPSGGIPSHLDGAASPRRQKPFLSNRAKKPSEHSPETPSGNEAHSPGLQKSVVRSKKETNVEELIVDKSALEQRVENLSDKIAELTALIMAQQGVDGEET